VVSSSKKPKSESIKPTSQILSATIADLFDADVLTGEDRASSPSP
jgi:hypothetical protein